MTDAHNPDVNPAWTPNVARRVYACDACGAECEMSTNHTGKVWGARCVGTCRQIINPHTVREIVLPFHGPHSMIREVAA